MGYFIVNIEFDENIKFTLKFIFHTLIKIAISFNVELLAYIIKCDRTSNLKVIFNIKQRKLKL